VGPRRRRLNGIGIRVAWETIRRQRPTDTITIDDEPAIEPPDTAERLDLEQALQRLPDDYRAVVVLHDVEGFSHDEIAASLGMAVGTSRSHLFRARRALRAMLSSYERIPK
jgi:RNA polymerase sigma factor (sigma-70 family)